MLSLVYASSATFPFTDGDLAVLLLNSRATNARLGLSGVLLHQDGEFMQVLEGPEDAVRARYAVIASDPRHARVTVLAEETTSERRFPDWTMGYRTVTDSFAGELPGYNDFFSAGAASDAAARIQRAVAAVGASSPSI